MTDYVDRKVPVDLHEWLMCRGPARLAPSLYQYKELNAEPEPLGPGDWAEVAGGFDQGVWIERVINPSLAVIWYYGQVGRSDWDVTTTRSLRFGVRCEPHPEAQSLYDLGIGPGSETPGFVTGETTVPEPPCGDRDPRQSNAGPCGRVGEHAIHSDGYGNHWTGPGVIGDTATEVTT